MIHRVNMHGYTVSSINQSEVIDGKVVRVFDVPCNIEAISL